MAVGWKSDMAVRAHLVCFWHIAAELWRYCLVRRRPDSRLPAETSPGLRRARPSAGGHAPRSTNLRTGMPCRRRAGRTRGCRASSRRPRCSSGRSRGRKDRLPLGNRPASDGSTITATAAGMREELTCMMRSPRRAPRACLSNRTGPRKPRRHSPSDAGPCGRSGGIHPASCRRRGQMRRCARMWAKCGRRVKPCSESPGLLRVPAGSNGQGFRPICRILAIGGSDKSCLVNILMSGSGRGI